MKKRFLFILVALVAVCIIALTPQKAEAAEITASGTCGAQGDNLTWTLDDEGTLTISGTGAMKDYQPSWGSYSANIKYVQIEDGVTSIGGGVFQNYSNLTAITIPESVTRIGNYAFYHCFKLTSVTIPDGVKSIGDYAFFDCGSLTSVVIGDGVTHIGNSAFYNCRSLTNLKIGNSVSYIGDWAFSWSEGITSIILPSTLTGLGYAPFSSCCNLQEILVDEENPYFSSSDGVLFNKDKTTLLYAPGALPGHYTIPDSVTHVGMLAFYGCDTVTSIDMPNSVTEVGEEAFSCCDSLTNVILSNKLTKVASYTFRGSKCLKSITIPDSVTSIGNSAFEDCTSLTSITIPDSVTSVGNAAFRDCSSLISIVIPNSVTIIGEYMFSGCSRLISIVIPNSVTGIGTHAFSYCSKLESIHIPEGVMSIGDYAFYSCSKLSSVTIPNSVFYIGSDAFRNCSSLTSIKLSSGMQYISERAFYYCDSLKSITIPYGITTICNNAFYNCSNLTSITIPDSVTKIEANAFNYCSKLWHVMYQGNETQWKAISISSSNYALTNAIRHYNSTGKEKLDLINMRCCICNGTCIDQDSNHNCDVCDTVLSKCVDRDLDNLCDTCRRTPYDLDVQFATTGLSLGTFIGLQSAIMKNTMNGGKFDEAYFLYNQYTADANGNLTLVATTRGEYIDMGSYFVSECPVNAKQMSDVFEITPIYVKDGTTYYGATTMTSVKSESMKKINDVNTTDKTKALCVAMLNYGAEAQKNFDYSLTNLANSKLSDAQKVLPTFSDLNIQKTNSIPEGVCKPTAAGLSLGDVVYMQFLVKIGSFAANGTLTYHIPNEEEVVLAMSNWEVYADSYYLVNIPIEAKYVRSDIMINFCDADNLTTYLMSCSIEAFATAKQGTSMETLAAALMAYGDAAKAVFG